MFETYPPTDVRVSAPTLTPQEYLIVTSVVPRSISSGLSVLPPFCRCRYENADGEKSGDASPSMKKVGIVLSASGDDIWEWKHQNKKCSHQVIERIFIFVLFIKKSLPISLLWTVNFRNSNVLSNL